MYRCVFDGGIWNVSTKCGFWMNKNLENVQRSIAMKNRSTFYVIVNPLSFSLRTRKISNTVKKKKMIRMIFISIWLEIATILLLLFFFFRKISTGANLTVKRVKANTCNSFNRKEEFAQNCLCACGVYPIHSFVRFRSFVHSFIYLFIFFWFRFVNRK